MTGDDRQRLALQLVQSHARGRSPDFNFVAAAVGALLVFFVVFFALATSIHVAGVDLCTVLVEEG
jgi:hypothetical protein